MTVSIITGDCIEQLSIIPAGHFQTCVTSPPYFGLRDYGVAGQIGLEDSLDEFIAKMVEVFRQVWRVLREDGTLWLNLGDSYAGGGNGGGGSFAKDGVRCAPPGTDKNKAARTGRRGVGGELKPKDLMMVPARVALALQADGWWLRSDIIWHKPNPMPESAHDRPTSAHEHVFLFSKSARYFYDADAIREGRTSDEDAATFRGGAYIGGEIDNNATGKRTVVGNCKIKVPGGWDRGDGSHGTLHRTGRTSGEYQEVPIKEGRNSRNVWTIATRPFTEAHFATFPPELAERCILAGSRRGDTVLDPFGGAGTTGMVADRLQRSAVLFEINPEYALMARRRLEKDRGALLNHIQEAVA
nr:site-specific DNA-methyltransferase [uncultured Acidocella sp.]